MKFSDILQWVKIPIISTNVCQEYYWKDTKSIIDKNTEICAGHGKVSEALIMFSIFSLIFLNLRLLLLLRI